MNRVYVQGCLISTSYYINSSEISGELSHVNMISSHAKITRYFQKWKDQHCYGYKIP